MWSYILTIVGITGFWMAGKKVWWAWYVNIANQGLWLAYALITGQWGFVLGTVFYTIVFVKNAISWTREHFDRKREFTWEEYLTTWQQLYLHKLGLRIPPDKAHRDTTYDLALEAMKGYNSKTIIEDEVSHIPAEDYSKGQTPKGVIVDLPDRLQYFEYPAEATIETDEVEYWQKMNSKFKDRLMDPTKMSVDEDGLKDDQGRPVFDD